jgi:uncharacterized protein YcfJ
MRGSLGAGIGLVLLAGCSTAQQANLQANVANLQATVAIVQPIASNIACADQAAANLTTQMLTATGDTAGATSAATASTVSGLLCNGLAKGATVSVPANLAPAVQALPTS